MSHSVLFRSAALALISLSISGCALLPHDLQRHAKWAPLRTISTPQDLMPADGYYYSAKVAIQRRDYASALELLQAARSRRADDVRVLNAFGVVYDKLGRFDLSERYYAQAAMIDSASMIVAANRAYSRELQGLVTAEAGRPVLAAASEPSAAPALASSVSPVRQAAMGPTLVAAGPNVLRLQLLSSGSGALKVAVQTGSKLTFVNASGRSTGAEVVRMALAARGWSVPGSRVPGAPAQRYTSIRYAEADAALALSLARTLPRSVKLISCGADCNGVRLEVGADTTGWKFAELGDFTRSRAN